MGFASVGITFVSGYFPSPLTNFVFYSAYGYGFPLPKYYPVLEIPCNSQIPQSCQIPPSYSPLYFALDCLFYTAIAYFMFVYKVRNEKTGGGWTVDSYADRSCRQPYGSLWSVVGVVDEKKGRK